MTDHRSFDHGSFDPSFALVPPLCAFFALWVAALSGCGADEHSLEQERTGGDGDGGGEVLSAIVVDRADVHQRIRGFGASSAWTAPSMSDDMADAFFSVDDGIGLNLLRIQIRPNGESTELATVDAAVARGAEVWAAPWSPPAAMKLDDEGMVPSTTTNGGILNPEFYAAWAQELADFAQLMSDRGTPLLGISAQNEPDYVADWDTCEYSPEELATFVGDFLAPALSELETKVPVIAPESANWGSIERYSDALLAYPPALESLLAFATHAYGNTPARELPSVLEAGGEIWLTEVSDPEQDEPDSGMGSALRVARLIHSDLTFGSVSAWHYWWLLPRGDVEDTNAALADRNFVLARRAYSLGHYSKFVRPGYVRLGATENPARLVFSSAFESPEGDEVVVVLSSDRETELEQEIHVPGSEITRVDVWITDASRALSLEDTQSMSGDTVMFTIPPNSVVTIVLELD